MSTNRPAEQADVDPEPRVGWRRRDHPVFTALAGFVPGLAFVALVPAVYVGVLRTVLSDASAEALFPFVLGTLALPLGLLVTERTRRFGRYMLLGMVVCAVVVIGVATLVIWLLSRGEN